MTVRPEATSPKPSRRPWAWVPSLYFAEGVPYVIAMVVSVTLYKKMGVSNAEIALYTSWLYLPWVIKPLWSPLVDILGTRRRWIVAMQLLIGAGLAGYAAFRAADQLPALAQWVGAHPAAPAPGAAVSPTQLLASCHEVPSPPPSHTKTGWPAG